MEKIDLKKKFKKLYNPSAKEVVVADIPEMNFLMVDGIGDPNKAPAFPDGIAALYSISYTLKFMLKKGKTAVDYVVMPLEGLWWADDMSDFMAGKKERWKWTLMIMQPDFVTDDMVKRAIEEAGKKKELAAMAKIRFETLHEGLSAQIMHIGPYSAETPTIQKVHDYIKEKGYDFAGKHHEIYLSDPRKTAPEKMKTVIRQPVR